MITCSICYDDTVEEIGEINSCVHRFCFPCIVKWSEQENSCPMCKQRFMTINRKRVAPDDVDDRSDDEAPLKRLRGAILERRVVLPRNQLYQPDNPIPAFLDTLACQVCGAGDDEANLLICDSCSRGYHTYCSQLDGIPEGEWHCPECQQTAQAAQRARRRGGAAARRSRARGELPAEMELDDMIINDTDISTSGSESEGQEDDSDGDEDDDEGGGESEEGISIDLTADNTAAAVGSAAAGRRPAARPRARRRRAGGRSRRTGGRRRRTTRTRRRRTGGRRTRRVAGAQREGQGGSSGCESMDDVMLSERARPRPVPLQVQDHLEGLRRNWQEIRSGAVPLPAANLAALDRMEQGRRRQQARPSGTASGSGQEDAMQRVWDVFDATRPSRSWTVASLRAAAAAAQPAADVPSPSQPLHQRPGIGAGPTATQAEVLSRIGQGRYSVMPTAQHAQQASRGSGAGATGRTQEEIHAEAAARWRLLQVGQQQRPQPARASATGAGTSRVQELVLALPAGARALPARSHHGPNLQRAAAALHGGVSSDHDVVSPGRSRGAATGVNVSRVRPLEPSSRRMLSQPAAPPAGSGGSTFLSSLLDDGSDCPRTNRLATAASHPPRYHLHPQLSSPTNSGSTPLRPPARVAPSAPAPVPACPTSLPLAPVPACPTSLPLAPPYSSLSRADTRHLHTHDTPAASSPADPFADLDEEEDVLVAQHAPGSRHHDLPPSTKRRPISTSLQAAAPSTSSMPSASDARHHPATSNSNKQRSLPPRDSLPAPLTDDRHLRGSQRTAAAADKNDVAFHCLQRSDSSVQAADNHSHSHSLPPDTAHQPSNDLHRRRTASHRTGAAPTLPATSQLATVQVAGARAGSGSVSSPHARLHSPRDTLRDDVNTTPFSLPYEAPRAGAEESGHQTDATTEAAASGHNDTTNCQHNHSQQQPDGGHHHRSSSHGGQRGRGGHGSLSSHNTKQQAMESVKVFLKPLFQNQRINRDEYKAIAQHATHSLSQQVAEGDLPPNVFEVSSCIVRDVVNEALSHCGVGFHV